MDGRFVVLLHTGHGELHYDFMISEGEVLATWQFGSNPAEIGIGDAISGRKLPDHRAKYLDFEGPVGENRGHVARIDGGAAAPAAISESKSEWTLFGDMMRGKYLLLCRDCGQMWELKRQAV